LLRQLIRATQSHEAALADIPPHILIVDDHRDIREPLSRYLKESGLKVATAETAVAAQQVLAETHVDLVVLDIMMPGEDGLSFCRRLRQESSVPVIFLSARTDEIDRVLGLEMGADDYLTKPFSPRELLARIWAVLRRTHELPPRQELAGARQARFEGWTFNLPQRELVRSDGRVVPLSGAEFRLLVTLVERPQVVFTRAQLLERLRGRRADLVFDRSVDTQISRLRRKLEDDPKQPRLIRTARGEGYVLACSVSTS
jgi:two-component system OmpR family response regulator